MRSDLTSSDADQLRIFSPQSSSGNECLADILYSGFGLASSFSGAATALNLSTSKLI
jgi:hypothetical protein